MSFVFEFFIAFIIALIVTNFTEWATHKWILHGIGKNKNSWFHYHWKHHNFSRKNNFNDPEYEAGILKSSSVRKEAFGLFIMLFSNINWLFVWPILFYWFCFFTLIYFFIHKYAHKYPNMTKKYFPWHYDHHMFDQNSNWCVTLPLFDYIFGTRVKGKYNIK